MITERRRSQRYPANFYIHMAIDDQIHRCFLVDLSSIGLYAEEPIKPFRRNSRAVQAEIPLPDTCDSLWTAGEVIHDRFDSLFHGSAIRFTAMARKHQRLLREWLRENQRRDLRIGRYSIQPFGQVVVFRPRRKLQRAA